jgi:hypothetical protein
VVLGKLILIVVAVLVVAWALGELLRQRRPSRKNRRY